MVRKVIQSGPATLSISLPSKWIKKFNIKKGQELGVEEQGNSLNISAQSLDSSDNALVNVSELNPISTKIIGIAYKSGYKQIKAVYTLGKKVIHRGRKIAEIDMIKNTFDHLIGMQLWEIGKSGNTNYAIAKESAKIIPKEFDSVLNKLFFHLMHQTDLILESLASKKDLFSESALTERLINQTQDLCIKILYLNGHDIYKKTLPCYNLVMKLESIGDKYFRIAERVHKNKIQIDKESIEYLNKLNLILEEIGSLNRKFISKKAINLVVKIEKNLVEYEEFMKKIRTQDNLIYYEIYSIGLEFLEVVENLFFLNQEILKEEI